MLGDLLGMRGVMNMNRGLGAFLSAAVVGLLASGCRGPVTSLLGDGTETRQLIRSEAELLGSENKLTIRQGSYVPELRIIGHSNEIRVEPGAAVARVKLIGEGNTVDTPQGMPMVVARIGPGNRLETGPAAKE